MDEYTGGYHAVSLNILGADRIEVNLYYQVTSREYIQFLSDQITGNAATLITKDGKNPYIIQSDPFFSKLKAWGITIWDLWWNTKDWPGAAPYLMTSALHTVEPTPPPGEPTPPPGEPTPTPPPAVCEMPAVPSGLTATGGNKQVKIDWLNLTNATSYNVFYDQSGKSQFIANTTTNSYTNIGLTNGQIYCYKVTAVNQCPNETLESGFSAVVCETASNKRK
jgi:hypothetical protein